MTIADLAARINAHLKNGIGIGARVAYTGVLNVPLCLRVHCVAIEYELCVAESNVDAATAERHLAWLDAGNVGLHLDMEAKKRTA